MLITSISLSAESPHVKAGEADSHLIAEGQMKTRKTGLTAWSSHVCQWQSKVREISSDSHVMYNSFIGFIIFYPCIYIWWKLLSLQMARAQELWQLFFSPLSWYLLPSARPCSWTCCVCVFLFHTCDWGRNNVYLSKYKAFGEILRILRIDPLLYRVRDASHKTCLNYRWGNWLLKLNKCLQWKKNSLNTLAR